MRSFSAAVTRGRWELACVPESSPPREVVLSPHNTTNLVLGDDVECDGTGEQGCMGSAATACCDGAAGTLEIRTSVTGLPPVFLCRQADKVVVTSDLSLLPARGVSLRIDPATATDLFQIGYPTRHQTLFRSVSLLPGGCVLCLDRRGQGQVRRSWKLPQADVRLDWKSYLDLQMAVFGTAVRAIDLSGTFLSLTGGLDTRTILMSLVADGRCVPAATLTGPSLSVDARLARALAGAYGFPHYLVRLDTDFLRDLPAYVVAASRSSGGLASLEEAPEIYFYRQLAGVGTRRLSGNLGNHVARMAGERLSLRGAETSILSRDIVLASAGRRPRPAFPSGMQRWDRAVRHTIHQSTLQLLANASIGQHFATQQSPYATRAVIESLSRSPASSRAIPPLSVRHARWRDLRHRLFGEAGDRSFQRAFVARGGGYASSCPINWGWLAGGGVSVGGAAMGALALADVVASWPNPASRGLRKLLAWTGTTGMHEIKPFGAWLTEWLGDFARDTLLSRAATESGLFDVGRLECVLQEHYRGTRCHTATITAALDLALAHQLFCTGTRARGPGERQTGVRERLTAGSGRAGPAPDRRPHARR